MEAVGGEAEPTVCTKHDMIQILERVPSKVGSRSLDRLPQASRTEERNQSQPLEPARRAVSPPPPPQEKPVAESPRSPVVSLAIRCLDRTVRPVMMDLRFSGLEAGMHVGRQLGVMLLAEFALAFPDKGGWLDEEMNLLSQGVTGSSELVFKKKFFVADEELSPQAEVDIALMYPQCVDGLLHGSFKCNQVRGQQHAESGSATHSIAGARGGSGDAAGPGGLRGRGREWRPQRVGTGRAATARLSQRRRRQVRHGPD